MTANESPAALLPDSAKARAYDKYMSELERLQAEQPRDSLSLQAGAVLLDHYAKEFASTAPGASESRGSVQDALRLLDKMDAWSDELDDEGMGIAYGAALHNYRVRSASLRAMLAAPTPPAVSNEEGAFTARVVEWKGIRFGVPAQIAKSFMEALEGTNGEPTAEHWRQAYEHWFDDHTIPKSEWEHVAALARELARSAAAKGEG